MSKAISDAKAEQVRKVVSKAFPGWADEFGEPRVVRDFYTHGDCAILWDGGPFEWAMQFCTMAAGYTAIDEEFGFKRKPINAPKDVFYEPIYTYALGLYPN